MPCVGCGNSPIFLRIRRKRNLTCRPARLILQGNRVLRRQARLGGFMPCRPANVNKGPYLVRQDEYEKRTQWRWEDSVVDDRKEHIEFRHGDAAETPCADWVPIARIGKPRQYLFPVQWLVKPDSTGHES